MSKMVMCEAIYDAMIQRDLDPETETFEDILMSCMGTAEQGGGDPLEWAVHHEQGDGLDALFNGMSGGGAPRMAHQIFLDWRGYVDKCCGEEMPMGELLAELVEAGVKACAD